MVNEKTPLNQSRSYSGPFGGHGVDESFVHPQTTEQKVFICFLIFMVACLVTMGVTITYNATAVKREIVQDDKEAADSLDLLNSLYRTTSGSILESGCESTLLLIRHCDDTSDTDGVVYQNGNNYCSWLGRERAYFFATLFDTPDNPQRRYPVPTKLFALTPKRTGSSTLGSKDNDNKEKGHNTYREIEMLMPLANKFNLTVDVYDFDFTALASDYFKLLQSGFMCGKVTVVTWKHDFIPDLAMALGCGPDEGCPRSYPDDTFDEVWQLKYVFDSRGKAKASQAPMDLPVEITSQGVYQINNVTFEFEKVPSTRHLGHNTILKTKKHPKKTSKHRKEYSVQPFWSVYGTKTFQHFDPLRFSTHVGDYPSGGSSAGGKWADEL